MLRPSSMWAIALAVVVLVGLAAGPCAAQVVVAPPAYVSYYSPPAVYCPPTVAYYPPATVSYYAAAPAVSYYAPPAVSYSYYAAPAASYYAGPAAYYSPAYTTAYRYGYGILPRNRLTTTSYYGYAPAVVPARANYYSPVYVYP